MWLFDNAGNVNLYCSLAVLLAGSVIYWFVKPTLFVELRLVSGFFNGFC